MKTKNFIAMLIVCLFVSYSSKAENRDVNSFSKVYVDNGISLYLSQRDSYSVNVEADDIVAGKVETTVENETLMVRVKNGEKLKKNEKVAVYVTLPTVEDIKVDGKASVHLETPINSDKHIAIHLNNGSNLNNATINAKELYLDISDKSTGKLTAVTAQSFTMNACRKAEVYAGDIYVDFAELNLFGNSMANMRVAATALAVRATKESSLTIGGKANTITVNATEDSVIKANNLEFEQSEVKKLSGSIINLAQK